jgi:hypothetical protein
MIIPKEVKEYIKKCTKDEFKVLLDIITDLKAEIAALKVQIEILREGENI